MGIVMSEIDAVNAVLAAHVAAVNACDIDANLAGFSDDQVYMPPNAPPMHGKPDLEAALKWWIENFEVSIDMVPEETVISGDWAFQWGFLKGSMRSRDGGDETPMDWKFVYIYKRQSDGNWKIARDIYNSNTPLDT